MKQNLTITLCLALCAMLSAEGTPNQKKFIRGNLAEKTAAVREASEYEAAELSRNAIQFAINYREILGKDRDLSALAVAGVLSLPSAYVKSLSAEEKAAVSSDFYRLYTLFSDETLKIAVLNRLSLLQLPGAEFASLLNKYVQGSDFQSASQAMNTAVFSTLGVIGGKESFPILFDCLERQEYASYNTEIKNAVIQLMEKSEAEVIAFIQNGTPQQCRNLFDLCVKNEKNSSKFKADIAENVLSRTIYIVENSSTADEQLLMLQAEAYNLLAEQKWTRASKKAIQFYDFSKKLYEEKKLSDALFSDIIAKLPDIAPLDCVSVLSSYLQQINRAKETETNVPADAVILSIIRSLGAIGDKNAFDSLLSVTYYNYSDSVIKAARDALAGLKW